MMILDSPGPTSDEEKCTKIANFPRSRSVFFHEVPRRGRGNGMLLRRLDGGE